MGIFTQDIGDMQQQIDIINTELARQTHFRGYYLLNAEIQALDNCANGDFAFSAQSGTVWMYETDWYDSGQLVPDQVTPASDANPLIDSDTGVAGISTDYSRGDHQHPLNISDEKPKIDVNLGTDGTADSYARSDHQHILNIDTTANKPVKDSGSGDQGDLDYYARSNHCHPLNIDIDTSKVHLVNASAASNGTSDYYCRNDHVHPEQLTYGGNLTATSFIKTGATSNDVLCGDGTTNSLSNLVTIDSDQTITGSSSTYASVVSGNIQLNTTPKSYDDGLRIVNTINNNSTIYLGTSTSSTGVIAGQFVILKRADGTLTICRSADQNTANRGLIISADGNTLSFNGTVIAGTGATTGATNGSVTYSEGNPILWGTNNAGTEGGFYSDGANVYWRARKVNVASVSP
ncbi:MAG: hypothetical protein EZS28_014171 [Streblomastix strix]|uniref:Uncharacterized protein n=1 Tax=Streblomastix strix TaxID=222440 RepID=A0A5J4W6M6_9EUKA|nr:MAG: hypothetical protein EZS28_014171 [Streblomastix strix]